MQVRKRCDRAPTRKLEGSRREGTIVAAKRSNRAVRPGNRQKDDEEGEQEKDKWKGGDNELKIFVSSSLL